MKTTEKPDYEIAREELESLYLSKFGHHGEVRSYGKQADDSGWNHTAWIVTIAGVGLKYKTGTGIKKAPTCAEVLACYCREGIEADCSFTEWCGNLGYDTDSKEAEKTYFACQESGERALRICGDRALYAKFAELSSRL